MSAALVPRLLTLVPVAFGISLLTFVLINLAPGDPVSAMIDPLELRAMPFEQQEMLRETLGLNRPLVVRYGLWLKEIATGNLGYSLQTGRPVDELIADRLPATLALLVPATLIAIVIGVLLGALSAVRQYSPIDHALTALTFFGLSLPTFFIAILGIYAFAVHLRWLPIFGMWTPGEPTGLNWDLVRHAILPIGTLTIVQIAGYLRLTRTAMLESLGGDFVVTARAKGLPERRVLWSHVFPNGLLPLVTVFGLEVPGLIAGSVFIETIFSWPGIGQLAFTALSQRDYPVQMGVAMMTATAVLLANLATDLTYMVVDPRIRDGAVR